LNVLTIHAEIEGMKKLPLFRTLLQELRSRPVEIKRLDGLARDLLKDPAAIPVCDLVAGTVDGRSGTLAVQSC
jgi:undecaprenyl phosphate-alpha-L-ara4FN deformylase